MAGTDWRPRKRRVRVVRMEVGNIDADKIPPRVTDHALLGRISSRFVANGESMRPRSSESAERDGSAIRCLGWHNSEAHIVGCRWGRSPKAKALPPSTRSYEAVGYRTCRFPPSRKLPPPTPNLRSARCDLLNGAPLSCFPPTEATRYPFFHNSKPRRKLA